MHLPCRFTFSSRLPRLGRSAAAWALALLAAGLSGADLPLASFQHPNFVGSGNCALCHSLLTDAARNDVSIDTHWRSSMMANSGKDPLWQAKVKSETLRHPALKSVIENKCATCHLPMARTQAAALNSPVEIHGAGFLSPTNGYHAAAMDGVSCALCHQIRGDGLGLSDSFSGHYQIDLTKQPPLRTIYGPFSNPVVTQMQNNIGYTPVQGGHVTQSALCGTCHNLRTPFVDRAGEVKGEFPEQMIYSEWEHSAYNSPLSSGRSCVECHMPAAAGGVVLSNRGGPGLNLPARSPFGQHHFVGGNLFMLDLLAANSAALQVTASRANFAATRQRTLEQLQRRTAALESTTLAWSGDILSVGLRVHNLAGHKVPAGLPSRRTWIHLEVRDAQGALLFSSGAPQPDGRIAGNDADFAPAACEPHYDVITHPDEVQIYEAVMEDTDGGVTYTLLRGARYRKDNRLLPAGFVKATAGPDVAPAGEAATDLNFTGGTDEVLYQINRDGRSGPFQVSARLLHQTVSHAFAADLLADAPAAPEIAAFATLYQTANKNPTVIAQLDLATDPAPLPGAAPDADPRLLNLSSRAQVGPADSPAIAGFVVAGETSQTVLIRAVGPTLSQAPFSLSGALADPSLTLYRGTTILARNSGIATSTQAAAIAAAARQVGAFALGSSGGDSALLLTLAPGAYTVVVGSAANLTGIALIEVYDASASRAGSRLANLSTRARAGSAEGTLIAGIVLSGTAPRRLLFRAVGPGLMPFGVTTALAQPTLTLFRGTQMLANNTNWTSSPDASALLAASISVGAFALTPGDAALIATLAPGSYTVQVTAPVPTTGIALIEAYELP